jgi:hypothetical protein
MKANILAKIKATKKTIARYKEMLEALNMTEKDSVVIQLKVYNERFFQLADLSNGANKDLFQEFIHKQIEKLEYKLHELRREGEQ